MSENRLHLEVTWPVSKTVALSRSNQLAERLRSEQRKLRRDLVCFRDDGVYIRGLFGCENKVPDVDRYKIVVAEETCPGQPLREFEVAVRQHNVADAVALLHASGDAGSPLVSTYPYVDRSVAAGCGRPALVIVLESPHREEYGDSLGKPIAPARGSTGARIHTFLGDVVNSCTEVRRRLRERAPVRVILSNPIPFQTSAYAIHGGSLDVSHKLRNFIWHGLWSDPELKLKTAFREKLRGYAPIGIVNACTAGGRPSRRGEVTNVLKAADGDDALDGVPLYEVNHPSTWGCSTRLTRVGSCLP